MAIILELEEGNRVAILVEGKRRILDIDADLASGDLDEDMQAVPGLLGWYTQLLAAARAHAEKCDAKYRAWRAETQREYLTDDPRLAEWKAKAAVEAEPAFKEHKDAIAEANALATRIDGAVWALREKANMLRSRGAMLRAEMSHLDPTTRVTTGKDRDAEMRRVMGASHDD